MIWALLLTVVLLALALSAFFSGAETGIYCMSRLRLQLGVQRDEAASKRLATMLQDEPGALTTTLIGTNLMNYITTTTVAYMLAELMGFSEVDTEIYTVAMLTPVVFVFGEVVPKNLFQRYADGLMMRGSRLLLLSEQLFRLTGVIWLLTRLSITMARLAGGRNETALAGMDPKRRVATLLQDALATEQSSEAQTELIDRVVRLSETPLHAVMVPRNEVAMLGAGASRRELLRFARRIRFSRVPVYQKSRRHVLGYVVIEDLLQSHRWRTVSDGVKPVLTLRPHDTVAVALNKMNDSHHALAVVTDRTGTMLGLVTLKDLLGEVVGELTVMD